MSQNFLGIPISLKSSSRGDKCLNSFFHKEGRVSWPFLATLTSLLALVLSIFSGILSVSPWKTTLESANGVGSGSPGVCPPTFCLLFWK